MLVSGFQISDAFLCGHVCEWLHPVFENENDV